MYLKKLSVRNYRKFGDKLQRIEFAHETWEEDTKLDTVKKDESEEVAEKYISKSSTLMVGKNNSGKTTVLSLMKCLKDKKCGSLDVFKYTDFNLNYLRKWYEDNIWMKDQKYIKDIAGQNLPVLEFNLEIGINDKDDVIGKFEDILIVRDIKKEADQQKEDVADVNIQIKYEVNNKIKFLDSLSKLNKNVTVKLSQLDLSMEEIEKNFPTDSVETSIAKLREKISSSEKIKRFIEFFEEENFRAYLQHFCGKYYILNFYAEGSDEPAKDFSLSSLLKVKTIDANTVKDGKTLTNAYNKIVTTYIKNHETEDLDNFMYQLNYQTKKTVDDNITKILQDAVTSIESAKNLKMNLKPDINLPTIFNHGIIYEYQENGNYIPENQFGLGYTNLMVIISEIVDYIELYGKEDINGAINILCIEEPESFMHPQMQELFIKNISKAIAKLIGNKGKNKLETFQIIITTHSSAILNSKIHSGNTLNNIVYLGCDSKNEIIVQNIKDEELTSTGKIDSGIFEYIKKYLRLEASDIFFTDAIVLVEGVSEETYIRYLIDNDEVLNKHHLKVYRIDGAYAHQFITLLTLLKIKTIIFTDLDLKRSEEEKTVKLSKVDEEDIIPKPITDLNNRISPNSCITTNQSLLAFIKKEKATDETEIINRFIIDCIGETESLKISRCNISLFTQGKINGNYATSFEEAIVLTNCKDNDDQFENKESLIKLLQYVHPQMKYFRGIDREFEMVDYSYMYQVKLSDGKSKFSTGLVFLNTTESEFEMRIPKYIEIGLQELKTHFSEETNDSID
ncbi:hypothetical protein IGJ55_001972 [Enterococcus sp. AZ170]|uniref:AAA family ATPase n=1 Tax=Enterococcus TaxID=1350 RepID=UPI001A90CCD8|nr:AAA family ATPase [Enterococcus ureilyticus]MBO0446895.1 AAA family ATPase [Enterococcus ureilyticus]